MPRKPKKPCAHPGCPNLTEKGATYCGEHKKKKHKEYDQNRQSSTKRGYNYNWSKLRGMKLNADPLCEICKKEGDITLGDIVHHIDENVFNLDWDNLQTVCFACHNRIHKRGKGM